MFEMLSEMPFEMVSRCFPKFLSKYCCHLFDIFSGTMSRSFRYLFRHTTDMFSTSFRHAIQLLFETLSAMFSRCSSSFLSTYCRDVSREAIDAFRDVIEISFEILSRYLSKYL